MTVVISKGASTVLEEATPVPRRTVPDSTIQLMLSHVANGMSLAAACEAVGVSRETIYRWMREGDHELVEAYAEATRKQVHSRFDRS